MKGGRLVGEGVLLILKIVDAFLAAQYSHACHAYCCAHPCVAPASVLHSTAVGGSVVGEVGPL